MAFNNAGRWWLKNGESMFIGISFGSPGINMGPIFATALPLPFDTIPTPSGITQLETSRQQVRFLYANGGTAWTYFWLVQNSPSPGWNSTWFTMSGGGPA